MKRFVLMTIILAGVMLSQAQGIFQLWGMTAKGGINNNGTIFKANNAVSSILTMHQFPTLKLGVAPRSEMIQYNGKFYGMTSQGGASNMGVIFEWNPVTNQYITKVEFDGTIGSFPFGPLSVSNGKFYGSTFLGGINNGGVIFEWDPVTNIIITRVDLSVAGIGRIWGGLVKYGQKFYSTSQLGGVNDVGVIFEWDPVTNIIAKKFDFSWTEGAYPLGSLTIGNDGKFYGLAIGGVNGEGVIYQWDPLTNLYAKKFDFDLPSDTVNGFSPVGRLTLYAGKFYGVTSQGGGNDAGVIFEWNPATNLYQKKYTLRLVDGGNPSAGLTYSNGRFYGMTMRGGANNEGVIFEWNPATNIYTKKIDLSQSSGGRPTGELVLDGDKFYGLTSAGGSNNAGVIFEWNPVSNLFNDKIDFGGSRSSGMPMGALIQKNDKLYGMTSNGGNFGLGEIFEWDLANNKYTKKFDFNGYNGEHPNGSLTLKDNSVYGMAISGGSNNVGVIFVLDLNTNVFVDLFNLDSANGKNPNGSLTLWNGKFYGMTTQGGANDAGVIFEFNPSTRVYTKKIDLALFGGRRPLGNLVVRNNKFYGMTNNGGIYGSGIIFEWDPATNIFAKKIDLQEHTLNSGGYPPGSLSLKNDKFYGFTSDGGANKTGIIFEWDPTTNELLKKIEFSSIHGTRGSYPVGCLIQNGDLFYGETGNGGLYNDGVIFEWNPVTNEFNKKIDFNSSSGRYPSFGNELCLVRAHITDGLPGTCISLPSILINSTNNNQWVAIMDDKGNAVAEIKANGNNLGLVNAAMFINAGAVRQDVNKKLYLDRSITITPQTQPTTPVDIRLYIKNSEYSALKSAVNTLGQSSGITSINDLAIYKVSGNCVSAIATLTNPITTTNSTWENDFVLAGSTSSLGSFYFAKGSCSAPSITEIYLSFDTLWPPFHAYRGVSVSYRTTGDCKCGTISNWLTVRSNEPESGTGNRDLSPDWVILDQHHVRLRAERDDHGNGRVYTITINSKNTAGLISTKEVKVIVPINMIAVTAKYLGAGNKMYLPADEVYDEASFDCKVIPNPSSQYFNLQIESMTEEKIEVAIFDITGKQVSKLVTEKNKLLRFGDDLKPGVYMVKVSQGDQQKIIKVVKQ